MTVTGCHQFRLTRNAGLDLSDDVEDLAKALEGESSQNRRFGAKVRSPGLTLSYSRWWINEFGFQQPFVKQVDAFVVWF